LVTELFLYDLGTGDSYHLMKDADLYPNVYVVDVPKTVTDVIVYRSLSEVEQKPVVDNSTVYHAWSATINETNNCITLVTEEQISVGPYVDEEKPEFALDRVYSDNSKAKWTEVYVYGWAESGLGNNTAAMTQIEGTDIWYYDFDDPLSPGSECFLFKNTSGGSTWKKQTPNIKVQDGMNCYVANKTSNVAGTWTTYSE
jgi:hypothetical protein